MAIPADERAALIQRARQAAERAYAPYSHFRVGAALLIVTDAGERRIVTGCNVENASYGLTLCAERAALATAVAQHHLGATTGARVTRIAVSCIDAPAADTPDALGDRAPCGACRQWIAELAPDAIISLDTGDTGETGGAPADYHIGDLLPLSFRLGGQG